MARILLHGGKTALIDDADIETVSRYKWHLNGSYARASLTAFGKPKKYVYMHRLIIGPESVENVDHVNGDPLDNRRCNLRTCNQAQNLYNASLRSDNKSGFKGTHLDKRRGKWKSEIRIKGTLKFLGYFGSPEDAALAYNFAAAEIAEDFARFNTPKEIGNGKV